MKSHVYIDGEPTKGVFDNLEQAQSAYLQEAMAGERVSIRTVNSPEPIQTWRYDESKGKWLESSLEHP